jgi:hypothetical protein
MFLLALVALFARYQWKYANVFADKMCVRTAANRINDTGKFVTGNGWKVICTFCEYSSNV